MNPYDNTETFLRVLREPRRNNYFYGKRMDVQHYQMEQDYGLIGGNIFHGELSLEQLFHMRPAPGFADYRTPVPGLYYASSATHAGGGVCGIPGMQAAKAALADRRATVRRR